MIDLFLYVFVCVCVRAILCVDFYFFFFAEKFRDYEILQKGEMQRIAIVLALLEVVLAGIIPPSHFETKEAQMVNEQAQVAVNPIYMPALNNNPPPTRYSYPTYPDHSPAASHTVQSGYEGYSAPTALLPQKSNQWSPRNIISSLTPIVNSLVLYGTRTSIVLLQLLLVTFMGVGITSLVCTYTNFCNSFMGFKTDVSANIHV